MTIAAVIADAPVTALGIQAVLGTVGNLDVVLVDGVAEAVAASAALVVVHLSERLRPGFQQSMSLFPQGTGFVVLADAQTIRDLPTDDSRIGFVDLASPLGTLSDAVRAVIEPEDDPLLSPREREVLAMIGMGLTQYQVSRRIGVSAHTVDTYMRRIRKKLNVGNKAEMACAAMRLGVIDPLGVHLSLTG